MLQKVAIGHGLRGGGLGLQKEASRRFPSVCSMRGLFGFGGFGGGGAPVDDTYYKLLEVGTDASPEEIKSAFRKQAMKHHPDKGGDIEQVTDVV